MIHTLIDQCKLGPGDIFIDLGAHNGEEIGALVELGVTVHSFEPHPIFWEGLVDEWGDNDLVHLNNKAAWIADCKKQLYFKHSPESPNGGASLIREKGNINPNLYTEVDCIDIAEYMYDLESHISVLKIDVEGAEYILLNHIVPILGCIGTIYCEDHSRKIPDPSWNIYKDYVLDRYSKMGREIRNW